MAVASYGSSTDSSGVVRILKDLDAPIEGRDVLIVEDIVDSGLTLSYLLRTLKARDRPRWRSARCSPSPSGARWTCRFATSGFEIPNRFAIGYGLDHGERFRNLPYVAVLEDGTGPRTERRTEWRRKGRKGRYTLARLAFHSAGGPLSCEQILQERGVPDPDRRRAGVLRPEADQPGRRRSPIRTTASSSAQVDDGRVKSVTLNTKNNTDRRRAQAGGGEARSTRPPIRTTPSRAWSTRCAARGASRST